MHSNICPSERQIDLPIRRFPDLQPHIEEQFLKYHAAHPHVYELFKTFAVQARGRWSHFGVGAIFERLRWETDVHSEDGQFKLNNNFRSCYSRLLIEDDPSFKDFFEVRHSPGHIEVLP